MSTHNQFFLKKNTYFQDNQETIIYVFIFSYEPNAYILSNWVMIMM